MSTGADALWSAGRYESVAAHLQPLADILLSAVEAELGDLQGLRLLDVGCGTGNVALEAAARGARVSGLDPARRLLDVAAERARREGVQLDLVPGDAQSMPWPDGTFDAVVSCVGVVFAPDQQAAARDLSRVCTDDGVVAVLAWQPATATDPLAGPVVEVIGPPPAGQPTPTDWGRTTHVTALFGDRATTTRAGQHDWHLTDVPEATRLLLKESPLHVAVRSGLDEDRRARFDQAVEATMTRMQTPDGVRFASPYLLTTSRQNQPPAAHP